jgi:hypothetical protein
VGVVMGGLAYDLDRTLQEIQDTNVEHWSAGAARPAAVSGQA